MMVGKSLQNAQLPPLQITKVNDSRTHIFQRNIVIRNYKNCAGTASSSLSLPDVFRGPGENGSRELTISITRSRFPNRPMEIILGGISSHWSTYKCAIRRSEDDDDDHEFAEVKFVRETNGNGSHVSGVFKDQLRDDLFMRLTLVVAGPTDSEKFTNVIQPQPVSVSKLFLKDLHSDFRIICSFENEDETVIPVHKNILSLASPYFKAMFQEETRESQNGHVTLTMMPYKALHEILHCIYHGEHTDNLKGHAMDVVLAADFLEMVRLRDFAASFVGRHLEKSTVFRVIRTSSQLNMNDLTRKACLFVKEHVPVDEAKREFAELLKKHPELMVSLLQLI